MLNGLQLLKLAGEMSSHASARHGYIANNIAHANTPGYEGRDIGSFQDSFDRGQTLNIRATRASHFSAPNASGSRENSFVTSAPSDGTGNTVSLEQEMVRMIENRQEHDLALSVYKSTLNIMRTSLGRG